jgi:predicted alpha/beta superfamily hydrolase
MKITVKKSFIWVIMTMFMVGMFKSPASASESKEIHLGKKIVFHSKVLNEDRDLLIYPADALEKKNHQRPVMFLLDGAFHFNHISGLVHHFRQLGIAPDMLVVALPNVDRNRDFLPAKIERTPTAGKADNFLAFFKQELIPFMEKTYNAAPYRILFGHSFGGVFNFHALYSEPELFNAHIAVSPSLWFADEMLVKKGEEFFKERKELKGFLYYTIGGDESARMKNEANNLLDILKQHAPGGFDWDYRLLENENHGTVPHITAYKALRKLFSGWRYNAFEDRENQSLERFLAHYRKLSKQFAFDIKPGEAQVNGFGYMFLGMKNYDKAIEVFQYNIKQFPDSPNVYDSIGEAFEKKGDLKSAKINYTKSTKMAEKVSDPRLNVFKKNLDRVVEALKKAK